MMAGEIGGLLGGLVGMALGAAAIYFGARASYKAAVNEAQRKIYRRVFWATGTVGAVLFVAIWVSVGGVVPRWVYPVAMLLMIVTLGLSLVFLNRRLAQLGPVVGSE